MYYYRYGQLGREMEERHEEQREKKPTHPEFLEDHRCWCRASPCRGVVEEVSQEEEEGGQVPSESPQAPSFAVRARSIEAY